MMRLTGFRSKKHSRDQELTRSVIEELNRSLLLIADPETLQASVASRIRDLFRPERIIILQQEAQRIRFRPSFSLGCDRNQLLQLRISLKGKLARWMLVNESVLSVDQLPGVVEYLDPPERELLSRFGISLCVPLITLNRLSGIILLGGGPQWKLSDEELTLLQTLANQAGLAFENAGFYREQRSRIQRLHRAEKLATAGQLAAGVAHEIRNPLTAIRSTIQYISDSFEEEDSRRELVEGVLREVDRIDQIVNHLLGLTRTVPFELTEVDVREILESSLVLISPQASGQGVEIERRFEQLPFFSLANAGQLRQVFLNLLLNALQAMPEGGRIGVSLARWRSDFVLSGRQWLQVSISDSGPGIPEENLERAFDPFFTTKPEGTGLGLSISHSIVEQHEGELEIQSSGSGGTTVSVRLPLSPGRGPDKRLNH